VESLKEYLSINNSITPKLVANGTTVNGANLISTGLTAKWDKIRHATTIKLVHSSAREAREEEFQKEIYWGIIKAAEELEIEIDESQIYNCLGIVEYLRRKKSVVLLGPLFTGKT